METTGAAETVEGTADTRRWWVLATVLSGLFASGLTITILTAAAPFIARDLDASASEVAWVVAAPFLLRAVFVPVFGRVADMVGRRRVWLAGFTGSMLCAVACGFAPTIEALIALRVLSAIGAAAVAPASLALIAEAFPPRERVRAMGWWAACIAGAPLVGVVAGGLVVETLSWRWVFFGQAPFAMIGVVLGLVVLRESRATEPRPFDLLGAVLSVAGLCALMLVLNQGPVWGWASRPVLAAALVAPLALAAFVRVELRAAAPILPLRYISSPGFAAALATTFVAQFAYMGAFFLVALYLADVLAYSPGQVALGVAPRAAALGVMGPIGGWLGARLGLRPAATAGTVLLVASMVALAMLDAQSSYAAVLPGLVLAGLGLGLVHPACAAAVTNAVHGDDLGVGGGTLGVASSVGASIGIAGMVAVATALEAAGLPAESAFSRAFLFGAGICALGIPASLRLRDQGPVPGRDQGVGEPVPLPGEPGLPRVRTF